MKKIIFTIIDDFQGKSFLADGISYNIFPYFQFYGEYVQNRTYVGTLICPSITFCVDVSPLILRKTDYTIVFPKIDGKNLKYENIQDFILDIDTFLLRYTSAHIVGKNKKSILIYGKNLPISTTIKISPDFQNLLPEKIQTLINNKTTIEKGSIESIIKNPDIISKLQYFVERRYDEIN